MIRRRRMCRTREAGYLRAVPCACGRQQWKLTPYLISVAPGSPRPDAHIAVE
jgi:hypothetical protein